MTAGPLGDIRLPLPPSDTPDQNRRALQIQAWLNALQGLVSWLTGSGAPAADLGNNGVFYLDIDTGDVYQKLIGEWSLVMNIKGAQGDTGGTGAKGDTGDDGTDGTSIVTTISASPPVDADGKPDGAIHFETV